MTAPKPMTRAGIPPGWALPTALARLPFRFYLITDRLHSQHQPTEWLPRLVAAGLKALQVREKDLDPKALCDYCETLQHTLVSGNQGLWIFLNDRADLALSLDLAGVHLREESLPISRHAPLLRNQLRYAASAHSLESVLAAEQAGADFATFGPVFPTASKTRYGEPVGLKALERVAAKTSLPLLALGGVTSKLAKDCLSAGAWGVASISAIWNAEDPLAALAQFHDALGAL